MNHDDKWITKHDFRIIPRPKFPGPEHTISASYSLVFVWKNVVNAYFPTNPHGLIMQYGSFSLVISSKVYAR